METETSVDDNLCPCFNCICVPVCKWKHYGILVECNLMFKFLYNNGNETIYQKNIINVAKCLGLKPVFIKIKDGGPVEYMLSQKQTFGN